MSTNHHDPYLDNVTRWKAEDMNPPLGQLDEAISNIEDTLNTTEPATAYIIGMFYNGTPPDSSLMAQHIFTDVNVSFASGLSGNKAVCENAPSTEVVLSIRKNGTEEGTITFAAAATSASFASAGFSCVEGDKLSIVSPASVDANIQDITISLKGSKDIPFPAV